MPLTSQRITAPTGTEKEVILTLGERSVTCYSCAFVRNPDTRFFVVHLQKTAGTTLRDRFRGSFDDAAIYPNASDGKDKRLSVISLSHLLDRWEVRGPEVRLVAGHFPLSTVELLGGNFVTLSVLRPPIERTLSYLRHQKKINPVDRDKSLEEIYDDPFRYAGLVRNHMTRMFAIKSDEMGPGDGVLTDMVDSPARLDDAKAGVASLDALGLQPHFDEFWQSLADRYALDAEQSVTSNTTESEDAPAHLIDRIATDNALDLGLYEFAEQNYRDRLSAGTQ
ncbi:MAG: hypothetical protein ACI9C1_002071 [Candidatus Aldehydirespiratoraceae bacterium]|jgi:hypothetical protein